MTVTAWVRLDDLPERGAIVGFQSKSRNNRDGWALGYNRNRSSFAWPPAKRTGGGQPGHLHGGKTPLRRNAGITWPPRSTGSGCGCTSTASSRPNRAQSGDIRYPENGAFLIGGTAGRPGELFEGGLYELKCYARDLSAEEIRAWPRRTKI